MKASDVTWAHPLITLEWMRLWNAQQLEHLRRDVRSGMDRLRRELFDGVVEPDKGVQFARMVKAQMRKPVPGGEWPPVAQMDFSLQDVKR